MKPTKKIISKERIYQNMFSTAYTTLILLLMVAFICSSFYVGISCLMSK